MLMKLTPVVNFTNILQAAFYQFFSKNYKLNSTVITERLPKTIMYEIGAHKILMKLKPEFDFINILPLDFTRIDPKSIEIPSRCQSFLCFWCLGESYLLVKH